MRFPQPLFLAVLTLFSLGSALAQNGEPPVPMATPSPGQIVPPPRTRRPGVGISGPGALTGPNWALMNQNVTGAAVQRGLLPRFKAILDVKMRAPAVTRGGDGKFYLTGTTGDDPWDYNDGIELWRSDDLQKWDYAGLVWSIEKDGTWEKDWRFHRKPVRAIWGAELHFIKGNYYMVYAMPPGNRGLLKSTSGKPEGPYVNALAEGKFLPGETEPSLFQDDDGKVYLVYSGVWIARMKDDLSGLAEEPRQLALNDPDLDPKHHSPTCTERRGCRDIGVESPCLFKRGGKYYFTAADVYEERYSSIAAVADNVYGPYSRRHEAVPCGGGGTYFQDAKGAWWTTFFGNDDQAPWREKPAILRVDFAKDGRIAVAKEQPAWVRAKAGAATPAK